ncbi:MAG: transglutaminase domain-containing protein [Muribaculaceae bacterium]|nr:transglutaminase domain-containing protein [Muribaculaceae bacterium]
MKNYLSLILLCIPSVVAAVTPDEALTFLYSTLSLPDKADYKEEFYRRNVEAAFKAKEEMPWGKDVPDREFLHFVVPVRVNNENLDLSRETFYEILKERVKGMSMKDAILEVNHWCHEHVTYQPSDARTSSPLSTMNQAVGRCGEESTFTVAALRSIGIPARQIYTPRWAHTDDNHAWVEAWADGEWHFLGACEPEAELDLAWFNTPASRGLLMNTNVPGDYDGPEEVLLKDPLSTRINVTANYAPVAQLPVKVVNADGTPANGAKVSFCIYNYAEYYPAVTKTADDTGETSLTTGLGDMFVWATDGTNFGFAKGSAADYVAAPVTKGSKIAAPISKQPLTIVLDKNANYEGIVEYNIIPPASAATSPGVSPDQRAANDRRLAREDSIRHAYTATFATPESAAKAAVKLGLDQDKLTKILIDSRGNHRTIEQALECLDPVRRSMAVDLLMNVSEKDRRDIPMNVISDHVVKVIGYGLDPDDDNYTEDPDFMGMEKNCFDKYVLNPRIENETLTAWRTDLRSKFSDEQLTRFRKNPVLLVEWVRDSIEAVPEENPQRLRMCPGSVVRERRADPLSRDIFFVALARTAGIPARIDPVTGATQYVATPYLNPKLQPDWVTVDLDEKVSMTTPLGDSSTSTKGKPSTLKINFSPEGYVTDPKYYSQFSLSRIIDGTPVLLEYPEEATVETLFSTPAEIQPGQYILTTGQRLADGGVLARSEFFNIEPGENVVRDLTIRQDNASVSVIGSLNAENIYHDIASDMDKSLLSTTGRGYYVVALVSPSHEPSAHMLNDISALAKEFEESGNKIMVLFEDKDKAERFDKTLFPNLPSTVVLGIDNDGSTRNEIVESLHLNAPADPIVVIADSFNRIVWVSTGYGVGNGDRLLSTLRSLKE